jgi:hypothetical protein
MIGTSSTAITIPKRMKNEPKNLPSGDTGAKSP